MSRIVGIDLGTTNSLVAYVDEKTGLSRVIPDGEGRVLLPSVVSFTDEGVVVGDAAKRLLVRRPAATVYSVKRLMGRGYEDVKEELCYLPFKVAPCDGIVRIQLGDREVTPPEVSAIVLKSLKERAEAHFGEPVEKAVITVPAYFNDSQRQATKDAGRIAGLDVVRIVNEPTAASLAYGLHRLKEGVIAVYDLGGGTFDISILRVKDGVFEVLATNGNTHLGGDDFDRAIVVWLLDDIRSKHGVYLGRDSEAMQELRLAAEAAKVRLSTEERTTLTIPFEGFTYHREITRAELEGLIGKLVDSTLGPCRMALADTGLALSAIDEVVLVGGSTRVPLLRRRVQELFGKTPHSQLNPDEVVALGAAVQAHILAGGITSMLLLDVTPLSLGIETLGGIVSVLIPRNTTIPTSAREMFTTSVDGQTVVDLHVVQGERELAKDCRSLARFELRAIDPMPADAEDRGHAPHRRQRDLAGPGQGAADRQGRVDRGETDLRAHGGRGRADGRGVVRLCGGRRRGAAPHRDAQRGGHGDHPRRAGTAPGCRPGGRGGARPHPDGAGGAPRRPADGRPRPHSRADD